jgi:hypothetical protein
MDVGQRAPRPFPAAGQVTDGIAGPLLLGVVRLSPPRNADANRLPLPPTRTRALRQPTHRPCSGVVDESDYPHSCYSIFILYTS